LELFITVFGRGESFKRLSLALYCFWVIGQKQFETRRSLGESCHKSRHVRGAIIDAKILRFCDSVRPHAFQMISKW
jgi:hypothetical protein